MNKAMWALPALLFGLGTTACGESACDKTASCCTAASAALMAANTMSGVTITCDANQTASGTDAQCELATAFTVGVLEGENVAVPSECQ